MDIVIRADGFEHSGAGGRGGLQRHVTTLQDCKHILQVAAIECNFGLTAFNRRRLNFILVIPNLFRACGYDRLPRGPALSVRDYLQPNNVAAVSGKNSGGSRRPQQLLEIEIRETRR